MLLIEIVINATTYYISDEPIVLTHYWDPYVLSLDAPRREIQTDHGGYVAVSFGSISLSPDLFASEWPPPAEVTATVKYTASTEGAAETLFVAVGYLSGFNRGSITYNFYEQEYDVDLLSTETDYDGETVVLPRAFGEVLHQNPVRLADVGGNPTYHNGYFSGNLAKEITGIYNNGSDKMLVYALAHGFSNDDTVYTEINESFDTSHAYNASGVISAVSTNYFTIASIAAETSATAIDSWATYDATREMGNADSLPTALGVAQCFALAGDSRITGVKFRVTVVENGADRDYTFNLKSVTGTVGSAAVPGGTTHATVTVSTADIATGPALHEATFTTPYIAAAGDYCVTLECSSETKDYLLIHTDQVSSTHAGNAAVIMTGGSWTASATEDVTFELMGEAKSAFTGHAYEAGDWRVYDDGVPISGNATDNADYTFELDATPAGQVTISGTGLDSTLSNVLDWACGASFLNLTYNSAKARSPSPTVSFWANNQSVITDFLSDMSAFFTHMFYISVTTLYLVDMATDNGSRTITDFDFFPATYTKNQPLKKVSASWIINERKDETVGKYIMAEPYEEAVLTDYAYGNELSVTPYSIDRATINAAIDLIITYSHNSRIRLPIPFEAGLPVPGEKITLTDTAVLVSTDMWFRVRSIQYDLISNVIYYEGEGTVSST